MKTLSFLARLSPHLLLAPILAITAVTFLHELAHAGMALSLGAQVTEFAFLPSGSEFGHIRYTSFTGTHRDPVFDGLVSVAPYVWWSAVAAAVAAFSLTPQRLHWTVASTLFVWDYVVPLGDVVMGVAVGSDLDVGVPGGEVVRALGLVALLVPYAFGYVVQRRLFRDDAVGPVGYVVASVVFCGAFGAAATLAAAVV